MMWRSRALSRLAGAGVSKFHSAPKAPIPHQVLRHYHLPPFSLISKTPFPQNPRLFSQDSADPIPDTGPKPPSLYDVNSEEIGDLSDHDTDQVNNLSEKGQEEGETPKELDLEKLESVRSILSSEGDSTSKSVESQLNEVDHDTEQVSDDIESSYNSFNLLEKWQEEGETPKVLDLEKLRTVRLLLWGLGRGYYDEVESMLNEVKGLTLSEEFVVRVLEVEPFSDTDIPEENLVHFSKWVTAAGSSENRKELCFTQRSFDALVHAIFCGGEVRRKVAYALWDFVKEVGQKGNGEVVVTTEVLNRLISCFSRLGKGLIGYEVFSKFGDLCCVPDANSYYYTLEGLCRRSRLGRVGPILDKMLDEGKLPEAKKIGTLIWLLCKRYKVKEAHSLYLSAKVKEKCPPQSSINVLITSLCDRVHQEDDAKSVYAALEMLEIFSGEEKRKYAIKQFACVIRGLCRIKDVERANDLLYKMIAAGPPPGNAVFNMIINSLSKSGDLDGAQRIMKLMESRGLKPDIYTYIVIASGYAKGGEMEKAVKVLAEAKENHRKLSPVIFNLIINSLSKSGDLDGAQRIMKLMESRGLKPDIYPYILIMSGYAKGGEMEKAVKVLAEAKENHQKLSPVMFHKIIRGYCNTEEYGKAVKLLAEMKKFGVHPTAEEYNMLIQSLCLKAADWETAEKLLEEMKKNGLRPYGNTVGLVRAIKELEEEGVEEEREVDAKEVAVEA